MNVLFATSEAHPLIKTGGLADVSGSLPAALLAAGHDVRLVLPAYPQAITGASPLTQLATLTLTGCNDPVTILEGHLPGSNVTVYLIDAPDYFRREGGPYSQPDGNDWPDNADRFACFCRAVTSIALNQAGLDWAVDIVHCNDWQTGLIPAMLVDSRQRPASVFTIHNLAYQGLFDQSQFHNLDLPASWWSMHQMEFHGQFSFVKGGLVNADWLTTVSPTYAREICTPQYGYGLEGLLSHRSGELTGILNGIDTDIWNPEKDPLIAKNYSAKTLERKRQNKAALQRTMGLAVEANTPLLGHVGRLVEQKGVDLILDLLPALARRGAQLAIIGTGDRHLESALRKASRHLPEQIGVALRYDESLSHLLEAGSDIFLMPSRFEPCGLNQLYSLRYGTPPVVRHTGGLADSIIAATPATMARKTANGFVFNDTTSSSLLDAIDDALTVYHDPDNWRQIIQTGMTTDHSWNKSATHYISVYEKAIDRNDNKLNL
ncbi:MAG: glycogen synthase GlgA [Gammaproteobacteria bacterium]